MMIALDPPAPIRHSHDRTDAARSAAPGVRRHACRPSRDRGRLGVGVRSHAPGRLHARLARVARRARAVRRARRGGARGRVGARPPPQPEHERLRLSDMPTHGDWVLLGETPPHEIGSGVVGRFWAGETVWEQIDAADFVTFDRSGFAKIACNFSLRPYGSAGSSIARLRPTRSSRACGSPSACRSCRCRSRSSSRASPRRSAA
jgi:hypothetical protein